MLNLHKQDLAEEDLINIWLHSLETYNLAQADSYL